MELFNHYSLDECLNLKLVKKALKSLENEGKIQYEIEREILHLTDLDLTEDDIEYLVGLFDEQDIFPYLDYEDNQEDDYDDYDDYDDEEQDY